MSASHQSADRQELTDRQREVLRALVELHLGDSRPVGSSALARRLGERWSSATLRADMAELAERGYLSQPHTSAGRVPTSLAWRAYAEEIASRRPPAAQAGFRAALRSPADRTTLMARACRALAERVPYVGVVVAPSAEAAVLTRLEFVPLEPRKVLAVLITRGGRVHHRAVTLDFDVTRTDLEQFHNHLNTWMTGLTLTQIRDRIEEELVRDRAHADRVVRGALLTGRRALEEGLDEGEVVIEGGTRFLAMEGFGSLDRVRPVLLALERKQSWLRLLDRSILAPAVGARLHIDARTIDGGLEECSVITARWSWAGEAGALGVVGPVRMDYGRVIPLVQIAAATLSDVLVHGAHA